MGIRIFTVDEATPVPRRSILELICDGEHADLFAPSPQRFEHPDGFIGQHAAAMRAGWIERQDGSRGRVWIGPCCSGKEPR